MGALLVHTSSSSNVLGTGANRPCTETSAGGVAYFLGDVVVRQRLCLWPTSWATWWYARIPACGVCGGRCTTRSCPWVTLTLQGSARLKKAANTEFPTRGDPNVATHTLSLETLSATCAQPRGAQQGEGGQCLQCLSTEITVQCLWDVLVQGPGPPAQAAPASTSSCQTSPAHAPGLRRLGS